MRITRSDEDQLVIVDFPWIFGVVCFPVAIVMFLVGAVDLIRAIYTPARPLVRQGPRTGLGPAHRRRALHRRRPRHLRPRRVHLRPHDPQADMVPPQPPQENGRRRPLRADSICLHRLQPRQLRQRCAFASPSRPKPAPSRSRPTYSSSSGADAVHFDRIRDAINKALKVSFDEAEQMDSQILELVLANRKIEAVKLARKRYGFDVGQAKAFVESLKN